MHGLGIFDIQIIEAFVAGMDISIEYNSIIYLKGYIGINTLINIKKYIGGEVLDFLNSLGPDFSLKQIGDFVDNLMDEIETKNLDEAEAKILVNDSVKNQLQKIEQLQQGPRTTQPLDPSKINREPTAVPVGEGGKSNRISNPKQNTKYRKKYKKFVSKYIIKKKRKSNKKNNKNKTRKNKRLTKSTPNSKRNNKTLKNKKRKSKLKSKSSKHKSNHKSKHNKKTKTNY